MGKLSSAQCGGNFSRTPWGVCDSGGGVGFTEGVPGGGSCPHLASMPKVSTVECGGGGGGQRLGALPGVCTDV